MCLTCTLALSGFWCLWSGLQDCSVHQGFSKEELTTWVQLHTWSCTSVWQVYSLGVLQCGFVAVRMYTNWDIQMHLCIVSMNTETYNFCTGFWMTWNVQQEIAMGGDNLNIRRQILSLLSFVDSSLPTTTLCTTLHDLFLESSTHCISWITWEKAWKSKIHNMFSCPLEYGRQAMHFNT